MESEIQLRIVLENSIEFVLYALQRGKGTSYQLVQEQEGKGGNLVFNFTVDVRQTKDSKLSLSGPFVQGPADNRFVYINLGSYAGQNGGPWNGRIKIPLSQSILDELSLAKGQYCFCCKVPGRTKEGKPVLATVKPFPGWFREEVKG